jgi:hypothetical protein
MSDDGRHRSMPDRAAPTDPEEAVETYETDDGTVLYDAGNPLAWIESSVTVSIEEAT